ncbi:MAG: hypothetical protein IVW56_09625 [Candidatus Binataceae bacterium]|nr:hypothetical protein [Candidatus Binataceae bacterium]
MDTNEMIERWWSDHFPGSAVARDTAAWNVAFAAKEELKRRLAPPAAVIAETPAQDHENVG